MIEFLHSREDFEYTPQQKERMKEIFIFYLWDMFQEADTTLTPDTFYIRKAVWYYRNLYFRNRAVFHCMIDTLFHSPWSLEEQPPPM